MCARKHGYIATRATPPPILEMQKLPLLARTEGPLWQWPAGTCAWWFPLSASRERGGGGAPPRERVGCASQCTARGSSSSFLLSRRDGKCEGEADREIPPGRKHSKTLKILSLPVCLLNPNAASLLLLLSISVAFMMLSALRHSYKGWRTNFKQTRK